MNIFGKKKQETFLEVEARFNRSGVLSRPADLRSKVNIVAVDDIGFPPEKNLANSGFEIQVLSDVQRIVDIEPYQIILCDVNGIGLNLSVATQGAYVISEIKKAYPDKVVVSYSAGLKSNPLVILAKEASDYSIRKDASIDDWRDLLDEIILDLCNPITMWKRERIRLLNAGIDLNELIILEETILLNLGKGAETVKSAVVAKAGPSGTQRGWTREVGNFLASKAFDIAFDQVFQ